MLLLIIGVVNTIQGIAAIGKAHFYVGNAHFAFGNIVLATCQGLRKHSYLAALVGLVAVLDDGDFEEPAMYAERERSR